MFGRWRKSRQARAEETGPRPQAEAEGEGDARAGYEVVASVLSDVGCKREVNEDCGRFIRRAEGDAFKSKGSLLVVADGMGGHSAGEVASSLAIEVISRVYYEDKSAPLPALQNAFREANRTIYEASLTDERLKGMGTTCTALALENGSAISAHVGDSRIYLVRNGQIYLMTEDHSAVMKMVKEGLLSLGEARHHPEKNVILRALGSQPEVEVSTWQQSFPVREGDRFLLCSDGLYDLVEDEEIKQIVVERDSHSACERLIALAKERGGHDNITVGIVSLQPAPGEARPTPQTRSVEAFNDR